MSQKTYKELVTSIQEFGKFVLLEITITVMLNEVKHPDSLISKNASLRYQAI